MKTIRLARAAGAGLAVVLLLVGLAGCATHKIDWSARVGTYTFDQAILDMGAPAKQATLKDGTVVADWMVQRGYTETYYAPYFYPPYYGFRHRYYYYGPMFGGPIVSSSPDVFIRLTFDPEGKLKSWKKVVL
jgi:hypothetical protein